MKSGCHVWGSVIKYGYPSEKEGEIDSGEFFSCWFAAFRQGIHF
ncbi:hypothetical protein [Enterocloster lavalensis]|nr:hypothetical protein [Enterocloster lavalensis]